jgi:hypothetical protein
MSQEDRNDFRAGADSPLRRFGPLRHCRGTHPLFKAIRINPGSPLRYGGNQWFQQTPLRGTAQPARYHPLLKIEKRRVNPHSRQKFRNHPLPAIKNMWYERGQPIFNLKGMKRSNV